jgi:hypothetical protein
VLVAERSVGAGVRQGDSKVILGRHLLLYAIGLGGDRDSHDMAAAARLHLAGCCRRRIDRLRKLAKLRSGGEWRWSKLSE